VAWQLVVSIVVGGNLYFVEVYLCLWKPRTLLLLRRLASRKSVEALILYLV
jgi:hypothetical protein